ncbi:A/G-specific adenine glycosylase [Ornithinibacillus halophilus]|uniref:Adenine DNA glycosylase n=1 Tax=Ornithinibacillus halophilus TaxID=930117 RepID=A0A1M5KJ82_9BACI|nr:A/G-specific adenine glycosylase [Ornithinibacillus halophilus]SHG52765.1 A/G-specific DNA-adenine glycosylase [Ornithinibacillus halophilus]
MSENTLQSFNISRFQEDILDWYEKNKRDLPWRQDQDPYKVWVSEIMLQQTKVDTVIPYFYKFMDKYPTVYDLAEADEQDVLKTWEGLGYYSRARNLQSAVREVVEKYDGVVPNNPEELGSLKGVGSYTRGAILSIAYNQPEPAVDGNFMRVFSRILKVEEDISKAKVKKLFEDYMYEIISKEDPSSFNQAIMDLGATICTPKSPMCMFCPVQEHCRAYAEGIEEELPIKSKKKKQKVKRYVALLVRNEKGQVIIEQRPESGLLANLWQFPMVPVDNLELLHVENWVRKEYGVEIDLDEKRGNVKHVFSHLKWNLDVYAASTKQDVLENDRLRFVTIEELDEYPFPVSHQKMMDLLK